MVRNSRRRDAGSFQASRLTRGRPSPAWRVPPGAFLVSLAMCCAHSPPAARCLQEAAVPFSPSSTIATWVGFSRRRADIAMILVQPDQPLPSGDDYVIVNIYCNTKPIPSLLRSLCLAPNVRISDCEQGGWEPSSSRAPSRTKVTASSSSKLASRPRTALPARLARCGTVSGEGVAAT
jgi:hypothetical protein